MIDFTTVEGARGAFRQLYNQVQSIFNWDIKGNRLQNVATGTSNGDAVNLKQLNDAIDSVKPKDSGSAGIVQTIANLLITVSLKLNWLTASLPLKLDAAKQVISAAIDLSSSTEVLNTLPENRGGTGTTTVGINGALTLTPTTANQGLATGAQSFTTTTLQYKDWAGVNQSIVVVTSVTLEPVVINALTLASPVMTAVSLTTNNFTKGKRTT